MARTPAYVLILAVSLAPALRAQDPFPQTPQAAVTQGTRVEQLPSNSVSHVAVEGGSIWIGTSKGLARSADGAHTWENYFGNPAFARPGIYSIALRGDTVWSATGYIRELDNAEVQTGSGYAYSTDNGVTWNSRPQPVDARDDSVVQYGINQVEFLPIVVPEQNVTFDVELTGRHVWVASWAGGIRRSSDLGATWERTVLPSRNLNSIAPEDTLQDYLIDPRRDNNFLGFAVHAENDSTIWAGTAGGVNKSTDGGISWVKFNRDNQVRPILGDWVIAIASQRTTAGTVVWTTNWPAEGENQQYGISATRDGGASWTNYLHDVKAYGFAFRDSIVYVATTEGLYRTADGGATWSHSGAIADADGPARNLSAGFFAVGVMADTVHGGNGDGLVSTADNDVTPFGQAWRVSHAYRPVGTQRVTYAYPNPFSPAFDATRIHYSLLDQAASVTVEVFDFGMNRVRTVVSAAPRTANTEYDEVWDGKDDEGATVPNGVYFYRVGIGDDEKMWGKILVVQ